MLAQIKPPFRAEHIGSLLRPKALLDQRAKFARGEIDQAADQSRRPGHQDALAAEQVGLKFATDGEFRRRSYHSFSTASLATSASTRSAASTPRAARRASASQPVAMIKSRVRWSHPINVPDFASSTPTPSIRRSPSPAPARCTFAAATRRAGRRLRTRPVLGRHGRGVRQGIAGARQRRLPLRADRRTAFAKLAIRGAGLAQGAATTGAR